MHPLSVLLALLLACSPADPKPAGGDTGETGDTGDTGDTRDTGAQPCGDGAALGEGEVRTTNGPFAGQVAGAGWSFLGVPFAAPPVGDRRLRAPEPPECVPEVRPAASYAPLCPQWEDAAGGTLTGAEDCLYLNVWAPAALADATEPLPVLLFLPGGGNVGGGTSVLSGEVALYDGASLAERFGVVVVTAAYRLGALGFLAHPALTAEAGASGNYGLQDQIAAIDWVRANASAFGGDPSRILLFGESAGALDACALHTSPLAAGKLAGVALESGGCAAEPLADAEVAGAGYAAAVGCDSAACLRALPWEDLASLSADPIGAYGVPGAGGFGPVVDGRVLPLDPAEALVVGAQDDIPLIVGSNTDETSQWVPALTDAEYEALVTATVGRELADEVLELYPVSAYGSGRDAWIAVTTDAAFGCPARSIAREAAATQAAPVYRYSFANVPNGASGAAYGAWHGLELLFVFQHLDEVVATTGYRADEGDRVVEAAMGEAWAALPDGGLDGLSFSWPPYDPDRDPVVVFDDPLATVEGPRTAECNFWDTLTTR